MQTLMVTSKRVVEVAFVSKELALKRFAQTQPEIARRACITNLFPDSFEVVPRSRRRRLPIILDFANGVDGRRERPRAACLRRA